MSEIKEEGKAQLFGSGKFEFGEWRTPFENAAIEILEVAYAPVRSWPDDDKPSYRDHSLLRSPGDNDLVLRMYLYDVNKTYRVVFEHVSAFRLLDEGGLPQFWKKTDELGGRPARTTFRVRNHLWSGESEISFFMGTKEGWSFVIASHNECVEILSEKEPVISEESPST